MRFGNGGRFVSEQVPARGAVPPRNRATSSSVGGRGDDRSRRTSNPVRGGERTSIAGETGLLQHTIGRTSSRTAPVPRPATVTANGNTRRSFDHRRLHSDHAAKAAPRRDSRSPSLSPIMRSQSPRNGHVFTPQLATWGSQIAPGRALLPRHTEREALPRRSKQEQTFAKGSDSDTGSEESHGGEKSMAIAVTEMARHEVRRQLATLRDDDTRQRQQDAYVPARLGFDARVAAAATARTREAPRIEPPTQSVVGELRTPPAVPRVTNTSTPSLNPLLATLAYGSEPPPSASSAAAQRGLWAAHRSPPALLRALPLQMPALVVSTTTLVPGSTILADFQHGRATRMMARRDGQRIGVASGDTASRRAWDERSDVSSSGSSGSSSSSSGARRRGAHDSRRDRQRRVAAAPPRLKSTPNRLAPAAHGVAAAEPPPSAVGDDGYTDTRAPGPVTEAAHAAEAAPTRTGAASVEVASSSSTAPPAQAVRVRRRVAIASPDAIAAASLQSPVPTAAARSSDPPVHMQPSVLMPSDVTRRPSPRLAYSQRVRAIRASVAQETGSATRQSQQPQARPQAAKAESSTPASGAIDTAQPHFVSDAAGSATSRLHDGSPRNSTSASAAAHAGADAEASTVQQLTQQVSALQRALASLQQELQGISKNSAPPVADRNIASDGSSSDGVNLSSSLSHPTDLPQSGEAVAQNVELAIQPEPEGTTVAPIAQAPTVAEHRRAHDAQTPQRPVKVGRRRISGVLGVAIADFCGDAAQRQIEHLAAGDAVLVLGSLTDGTGWWFVRRMRTPLDAQDVAGVGGHQYFSSRGYAPASYVSLSGRRGSTSSAQSYASDTDSDADASESPNPDDEDDAAAADTFTAAIHDMQPDKQDEYDGRERAAAASRNLAAATGNTVDLQGSRNDSVASDSGASAMLNNQRDASRHSTDTSHSVSAGNGASGLPAFSREKAPVGLPSATLLLELQRGSSALRSQSREAQLREYESRRTRMILPTMSSPHSPFMDSRADTRVAVLQAAGTQQPIHAAPLSSDVQLVSASSRVPIVANDAPRAGDTKIDHGSVAAAPPGATAHILALQRARQLLQRLRGDASPLTATSPPHVAPAATQDYGNSSSADSNSSAGSHIAPTPEPRTTTLAEAALSPALLPPHVLPSPEKYASRFTELAAAAAAAVRAADNYSLRVAARQTHEHESAGGATIAEVATAHDLGDSASYQREVVFAPPAVVRDAAAGTFLSYAQAHVRPPAAVTVSPSAAPQQQQQQQQLGHDAVRPSPSTHQRTRSPYRLLKDRTSPVLKSIRNGGANGSPGSQEAALTVPTLTLKSSANSPTYDSNDHPTEPQQETALPMPLSPTSTRRRAVALAELQRQRQRAREMTQHEVPTSLSEADIHGGGATAHRDDNASVRSNGTSGVRNSPRLSIASSSKWSGTAFFSTLFRGHVGPRPAPMSGISPTRAVPDGKQHDNDSSPSAPASTNVIEGSAGGLSPRHILDARVRGGETRVSKQAPRASGTTPGHDISPRRQHHDPQAAFPSTASGLWPRAALNNDDHVRAQSPNMPRIVLQPHKVTSPRPKGAMNAQLPAPRSDATSLADVTRGLDALTAAMKRPRGRPENVDRLSEQKHTLPVLQVAEGLSAVMQFARIPLQPLQPAPLQRQFSRLPLQQVPRPDEGAGSMGTMKRQLPRGATTVSTLGGPTSVTSARGRVAEPSNEAKTTSSVRPLNAGPQVPLVLNAMRDGRLVQPVLTHPVINAGGASSVAAQHAGALHRVPMLPQRVARPDSDSSAPDVPPDSARLPPHLRRRA